MPPRMEQVHDEAVEQYFSKTVDPQWDDFNLPARRSHGRISSPSFVFSPFVPKRIDEIELCYVI